MKNISACAIFFEKETYASTWRKKGEPDTFLCVTHYLNICHVLFSFENRSMHVKIKRRVTFFFENCEMAIHVRIIRGEKET
jgi:hypothetical protein